MPSEESLTAQQVTPVDIKLNREEQALTIKWQDGHVSRFDMVKLRKACPCATCNSERQQRASSKALFNILKVDPGTGSPSAVAAQLVGRYALNITWSDGHSTGIFKFSFLRAMDDSAPTDARR
jgi:DUF971 family protein